MKIIDQTNRTISKQKGRVKKRSAPGSNAPFSINVIRTKNLSERSPKQSDSSTSGTKDNDNSTPSLTLNIDSLEGNTFSSMLFQELEMLMQPAESFGLDIMNSSTGGTDHEAQKNQFMDTVMKEYDINEFQPSVNPSSPNWNNEDPNSTYTYENSDIQSEFRFTNHYLRHMCEFYSVKEPKWNFYSMVSSYLAYRYRPLQCSLLAWSGLHLNIVEKTDNKLPKRLFHTALSFIMKENFLTSTVPVEVLLSTAFFLCLYDIMEGAGNTVHILRHVWSTVGVNNFFDPKMEGSYSAIAYQVITWLIYLDIRSSLFIGNISFPDFFLLGSKKRTGLRNNLNVEYLAVSDLYESKTVLGIYVKSRHVLSDMYGESYPRESIVSDNTLDKLLVLLVKNMLLLGSLIRLRCWIELCGNSTEFDPQSFEKKISSLYEESNQLNYIKDKDYITEFHVLIINLLIHTSLIYFDRICHPDIRTNEESQNSATEVFRITVKLKKLRGIKTPGSFLLPFPLFIAGIETTDEIYKNWIVNELETYEKEYWGINITKTITLMKECWLEQDKSDVRVDVGPIMEKFTGYFVI